MLHMIVMMKMIILKDFLIKHISMLYMEFMLN